MLPHVSPVEDVMLMKSMFLVVRQPSFTSIVSVYSAGQFERGAAKLTSPAGIPGKHWALTQH